jgi:hypothetical protein
MKVGERIQMEHIRRYAPLFAALPLINLILAAVLYTLSVSLAPIITLTIVSCIFPFQLYVAARSGVFGTRTGPLRWRTRPAAYWSTFILLILFYLMFTGLMAGLVCWRVRG